MIRKITDAMVEIDGEAMRGVTWVRVHGVASGEWGISGKVPTSDLVRSNAMSCASSISFPQWLSTARSADAPQE